MANNDRYRPINSFMCALAVIGGLVTAIRLLAGGSTAVWADNLMPLLLYVLLGLVGFGRLAVQSRQGRKMVTVSYLEQVGSIFITIAKGFRQYRWMAVVAIGLAGVNVAGLIVGGILRLVFNSTGLWTGGYIPYADDLSRKLVTALQQGARFPAPTLLGSFIPGARLSTDPFVVFFLAAVIMIVLMGYLPQVRRVLAPTNEENDSPLVDALLPALACLCVAVLVGCPVLYIKRSAFSTIPIDLILLSSIAGVVISAIFNAGVAGGLLGSLRRSSSGEAVTKESFLQDALAHFERLFGVYLILGLVPFALSVPAFFTVSGYDSGNYGLFSSAQVTLLFGRSTEFLLLPFMFAPLLAVTGEHDSLSSIRESFREWVNVLRDVLAFIAVGSSILLVVRGVLRIVSAIFPDFFSAIINEAGYALVSVFMTAAVWMFYARVREAQGGRT